MNTPPFIVISQKTAQLYMVPQGMALVGGAIPNTWYLSKKPRTTIAQIWYKWRHRHEIAIHEAHQ